MFLLKFIFFLWLLSHNKLITRDNLVKRQHLDDLSCMFCCEKETSNHIFFECVLAQEIWNIIYASTDMHGHPTYGDISDMWARDKKYQANNLINAATIWAIWKCRNDLCFNGKSWLGLQVILRKIASLCSQWKILCAGSARGRVETSTLSIWEAARKPPLLLWPKPG